MKNIRAFTLIETLVYIALFSLFITGAVMSSYELTESSQVNHTDAEVEIEGQFLLSKIEYDLARSIDPTTINADMNMTISNIKIEPETEGVVSYTDISFTLSSRAPTGRVVNQNFTDVYFQQ